MDPHDLIDRLSRDLAPTSPVKPASFWTASWLALSLGTLFAAIVGWLGFRDSLEESLGTFQFSAKLALLLLVSIASMALSFRLSLPGRSTSVFLQHAPAGLLGAFVLALAGEVLTAGTLSEPGLTCAAYVICLSLLPALLAIHFLRKLAPLRPRRVAGLLGLAAGSLGAMGIGLHCPSDLPMHWVLWHALPIGLIAAFTSLLAMRFLRW